MNEINLINNFKKFLERKYKKEIDDNRYVIVLEGSIGALKWRPDVSLIDIGSGKIKAIYEIKARNDDFSVKFAKIQLMKLLSTLDEPVDAFIALPKDNNANDFSLIKVKGKNIYKKTIDEFKLWSEVLALLTAIILGLSIFKVIILDNYFLVLYGIVIVLLLAPRVQEISFLSFTIRRLEHDLEREQ